MIGSSKGFFASVACTLLVFGASTSHAATITLTNIDTGWYNDEGYHLQANKNYIAGSIVVVPITRFFNNFFVFDLPAFSETITSAELRVFTAIVSQPGIFQLSDVSTPLADLRADQTTRTDIYADLGSGAAYGSGSIAPADSDTVITLTLNAAAIAALQGSGGANFALGGLFASVPDGFAFGGSNDRVPDPRNQLILQTQPNAPPVPEPASMLLLGSGLAGVAAMARRRRVLSS